jgi:hypothetical protein
MLPESLVGFLNRDFKHPNGDRECLKPIEGANAPRSYLIY